MLFRVNVGEEGKELVWIVWIGSIIRYHVGCMLLSGLDRIHFYALSCNYEFRLLYEKSIDCRFGKDVGSYWRGFG